MSRFPRIDSPCPLTQDEQRAIDGHCSRCDKQVHALDALNEDERRALLAAATGPICVSYRVATPRKVGRFGAAIAATLIGTGAATAAYASDADPTASALPPPPAQSGPSWAQTHVDDSLALGDDIVFVGGINDPQDAQFAEDTSIPALPMRAPERQHSPVEQDSVVRGEVELDFLAVIGGGVSDPADAQWVEADAARDALPDLPMIAAHSDTAPKGEGP